MPLKVDYLLIENIRALLSARGITEGALAFAVGHSQAWISKILSRDRQMSLADVDRVADFFGLTASQLLGHGIGPLTERRRHERRAGDRRAGRDRRQNATRDPFASREYPHERLRDRRAVM